MSKRFLTTMSAMALAFGIALIGCDTDGSGGGSGTSLAGTVWEGPASASMTDGYSGFTLRMTFTATTVTQDRLLNGNFVQPYFSNASYTYSGGTVTITFPAPALGQDYLRDILVTVSGDKMTFVVGEVTYILTKVTSSTSKPEDPASLAGTGWTKYTLLLEGVTEGATYSATVYNSEEASVSTAPGVKATGETVAITLVPGTKSPDPYFYPGVPYSVQLKGVRKESTTKGVTKTNVINDTEKREISDFFFNEGDHSNTVKINWGEDSEFVSRTVAGSTGSDADEVSVLLNVNSDYEYTLSVTIAYNGEEVISDEVVSTGSVESKWVDESAESDGSELSEWWTFEPYDENDVIWTESYYPVYTGDLIFVMRNLITTIADKAAALQEALEEAEAAADAAVEALEEAEYLKEALEKALKEGNAEKAAALAEALETAKDAAEAAVAVAAALEEAEAAVSLRRVL